jgi:multidrug resistance efflux pump
MPRLSARRMWVGGSLLVTAATVAGLPLRSSADGPAASSSAPAAPPATQPATAAATSSAPTTTAPTTGPSTSPATAAAPATAPAGPPTVKVTRGDLTLEVRADALFQPADAFEVKPTFKVYGGPLVVASVLPPNSLVRKDQLLVAFDRTWVDWALATTENELAVAKAALAKTEVDQKLATAAEQTGLRQAEDAVRNGEGTKKWFEEVDGPQLLLQADLMLKQAQTAVDDQSDELDQLKKMYQGEELTTATADIVVRRAVRSLEQSKIVLKMQQERRDKAKTFEFPITRQRMLDNLEATRQTLVGVKAAQEQAAVQRVAALQAAKTAVEAATKRLADLKEDAAQFQFKAGSEGVLSYGTQADGAWVNGDPKLFKVGERVAAGQVLMRVYRPGKLRLTLNVPEAQAFWVEQGMPARVTPSAMPQAGYEAKTAAVETISKPNVGLAFAVNVDAENVDAALTPGMRATVVIDAGKVSDALLVPLPAVTAGKARVKQKDGSIVERAVKLGKTDGQQAEVKSGLSEGDEVVAKK